MIWHKAATLFCRGCQSDWVGRVLVSQWAGRSVSNFTTLKHNLQQAIYYPTLLLYVGSSVLYICCIRTCIEIHLWQANETTTSSAKSSWFAAGYIYKRYVYKRYIYKRYIYIHKRYIYNLYSSQWPSGCLISSTNIQILCRKKEHQTVLTEVE